METAHTTTPDLLSQYCEQYAGGRGLLIPYAAEVVLIARMDGVRQCAEFFGHILKRKISRKPVTDILDKVRRGEIHVTREQLMAVASSHPRAARFLEVCPWAAEPSGEKTIPTSDSQNSSPARSSRTKPPRASQAESSPPTTTFDAVGARNIAATSNSCENFNTPAQADRSSALIPNGAEQIRQKMAEIAARQVAINNAEVVDPIISKGLDEIKEAMRYKG